MRLGKEAARNARYPVFMTICFGHITALELWRVVRSSPDFRVSPSRALVPNVVHASEAQSLVRNLHAAGFEFSIPLHIVVSKPNGRRRPMDIAPHVTQAPCELRKIQCAFGEFYLPTPAELMVQLGSSLPFEALIMVGYELCGTYAIAHPRRGFLKSPAIAGSAEMLSYARAATNRPGCLRAQKALAFVADGSASPAETKLAMLLSLKRMHGGYGLPLPRMNIRLELTDGAEKATTRRSFVCDLFWKSTMLDVEYDSDAFHASPDAIASDAERRNALGCMGIDVITITNAQMGNEFLFDKAARVIARKLGVALRADTYDWAQRRQQLRQRLLGK